MIPFAVGAFYSSNPAASKASNTEIVVIVNSANPADKLSATEIRNYWMRKGVQKTWPSLKTDVKPVDRKNKSAEKTLFYNKLIGLSEVDVDSYFAAKQYQNAENPPVKFTTDEEIINYVSENRGAIGFINKASLAEGKNVKVVFSIAD